MSPSADSDDVAGALKKMGYRLIGGGAMKELSREKMTEAVEALTKAAKGAEAAVFYFSGHGVQIGEENYLLPVDMPKITGLAQMRGRAVSLRDSVMVGLEESGVETKVVVLDCCRDNPFSTQLEAAMAGLGKSVRTKGVGEMSGYGAGFYLAFATSPGREALDGNGKRNSPFTAAFLASLENGGGKDIDLLFRDVKRLMPRDQVSWTNSSLEKEFSLSLVGLEKGGGGMKEAVVKEEVVPVREGKEAGELYVNGLGMAFRWCPAGEFEMGSGKAEQEMAKKWGWDASGEIRHRVKLTRGYWMRETEVSQADWKRVMGSGLREEAERCFRSEDEVPVGGEKKMKLREFFGAQVGDDVQKFLGVEDSDYPMFFVDWMGAKSFCERLTLVEKESGKLDAGWRYDLPTEAQWEYACRAGSSTAVYSGEMRIDGKNSAPVLNGIAWYGGNSAVGYSGRGMLFRGSFTNSVNWEGMAFSGGLCGPRKCGDKASNLWGLSDMIGNVSEWCLDWYGPYSPKGATTAVDPKGSSPGLIPIRSSRGGSWIFGPAFCRAATRGGGAPSYRSNDLGFRPVLLRD
jgi:formylglycine-generating enzyme required for sulfatase activity